MLSVLVLAGLARDIHDRVRSESANRFVPNGILIRKPLLRRPYSTDYANDILDETHKCAVGLAEHQRLSITVAYVDYQDQATANFANNFFPFALPNPLTPFEPDWSTGKNSYNRSLNGYLDYLERECRRLRHMSFVVKKFTDTANLNPLLLPPKNFRSNELIELLKNLFFGLSLSPDPEMLLSTEINKFIQRKPYVTPPDDQRRCLSDGHLYFKSPGKDRHGFFRNSSAMEHPLTCLLSARSRLGGAFDYKFHFDCTVTRGSLAAKYPNCHGDPTSPKPKHVNIAPNDYIR